MRDALSAFQQARSSRELILLCYKILLIFLFNFPLYAQQFETEDGVVEFVGLKNWKVEDLVDSLSALDSNNNLHACAAILKQHYNFADASVMNLVTEEGLYTIVTVIEPQDSFRVNYKSDLNYKSEIEVNWDDLIRLTEDISTVQIGLQYYGGILQGDIEATHNKIKKYTDIIDVNNLNSLWSILYNHQNAVDKDIAIKILAGDRNPKKRIAAALILSSFSNDDKCWQVLVESLRDPDENVRLMAYLALNMYVNYFARKIDWTESKTSLRWLLNGTNLASFEILLRLLEKTELTSELGKQLLCNNYEFVSDYLGVQNIESKSKILSFLKFIYKESFITEEEWRNYLIKLECK